jgi:hypothetical protein
MNKQKSGTAKGQQSSGAKENSNGGNQSSKTKTATSDTKERGSSGRTSSVQSKK